MTDIARAFRTGTLPLQHRGAIEFANVRSRNSENAGAHNTSVFVHPSLRSWLYWGKPSASLIHGKRRCVQT